MNIFKLHPDGSVIYYMLEREIYLNETSRKYPYFYDCGDKIRHYAVCPACNNPIQIIGLFRKHTESPLYAKHIPKTIPDLAEYRQEAYENCPLAAKRNICAEKGQKKRGNDGISKQLLNIIEKNFDRIVYVLQRSLGIYVSARLAENLLDDYLKEEAYLYKYASLINIPWMLAYFSRSRSLVRRIIHDEDIRKTIQKKVADATFNEKGQLIVKDDGKIRILFYFTNHNIKFEKGFTCESIDMEIYLSIMGRKEKICTKTISFDYDYFRYMRNIPENKGRRNGELIALAQDKPRRYREDRKKFTFKDS
ncbi:MAG TPA: hypothetical protein H9774_02875 [Candidatus Desulfovibrio gallistercoris]|nr:hypothetical protein [Candidatus Desulfovibrio gallistercoris]